MLRRKHFVLPSGETKTETGTSEAPNSALDASNPKRIERLSEEWWARSKHPERRCTAHRSDGTLARCKNPALKFQKVCRYHGGAVKRSKAAAERRLGEHLDRMARELLGMATDDNVSDAVKLGAIKHALALGGISEKTAVEVEHSVKPYERVLANIKGIRFGSREESRARRGLPAIERATDEQPVIDAEVVEDGADLAADERTRRKRPSPRPDREPSPYEQKPPPITGMAAIEEAARANRAAGVYGKRRRR